MATARIAVKARYWPAITRLAEPRCPAPWAKNSDKITMSSRLVTANSPAASAMTRAIMGAQPSRTGDGLATGATGRGGVGAARRPLPAALDRAQQDPDSEAED